MSKMEVISEKLANLSMMTGVIAGSIEFVRVNADNNEDKKTYLDIMFMLEQTAERVNQDALDMEELFGKIEGALS